MNDTIVSIARPSLAVWKFASCDGCQLSLLNCEDELLTLAKSVRIAHFTEMTRASVRGHRRWHTGAEKFRRAR